MITDTNNVTDFITNALIGSTSGDVLLLGILVFGIIAIALVLGKSRASTSVMVGVMWVFLFGLLNPQFVFLFWLAILGSIFVLINGLRKWIQGV